MTKLARQAILGMLTSRPFHRHLGRFFSHPIALLAIATVFATIAGVWLTNYYQERAWVREKQFETFRYTFDEGLKLIDELSEAMSKRLFGLNRVAWVTKGTGTGELEQVWNEYYDSVVDWNVKLARFKGRLARFVGPEVAEAFASQQDATFGDADGTPSSIHGQFLVAHQKVRALVDCIRQHCSEQGRQAALKDVEQQLNALGLGVDQFVQACTEGVYEHAGSL